jgi:16S rRNA processing protein RimM
MSYLYLGKIVNTHGIKGELRLISDFDKKELVFKKGFQIYIGPEKKQEKIKTYRHHKNFEMITLEGYNNINEVLKYCHNKVYIQKKDLNLADNDYVLEELIDCQIQLNEEIIGQVKEIEYNKANILLKVLTPKGKTFYIPKHENFIENIDVKKKIIKVQNIQGLII